MLTDAQVDQIADLAGKHARERAVLMARHANEREELSHAQAKEMAALDEDIRVKASMGHPENVMSLVSELPEKTSGPNF